MLRRGRAQQLLTIPAQYIAHFNLYLLTGTTRALTSLSFTPLADVIFATSGQGISERMPGTTI